MRSQARQKSRSSQAVAAALAVGVMAVGLLAPTASASATASATIPKPDTVQRGLDALVRHDGVPAALASVSVGTRTGTSRTRTYTAGVGDLATRSEVPRDGQVRVGSNTKAFTAVVVLQLVDEGRIALDAPVDTYLPGLLRGDGIDGNRITVRHLLQQTSGLPNYTEYEDLQPRPYDPRELVGFALKHGSEFEPGKGWGYSNTNYVVAGLLVEEVTHRPFAEELERRVIKKAGLRHTYFPAPGETTIREPHPHGYYPMREGAPLSDVTEMDPSWTWSAGQLVSTNTDLNRFYGALLAGDLVSGEQLRQMRRTVPVPASVDDFGPGARYGLGLVSKPLSCGGRYWGHGGSFPGYETRGGATVGGRAANVAVTVQPKDAAAMARVDGVVDAALCHR